MSHFFHVFIIGAASYGENSGQLPTVMDIRDFANNNPKYQFYFYCIDPGHNRSESDLKLFKSYTENEILFSHVPFYFDFKTYSKCYKVSKDDYALFIDFSGMTFSEYDFVYNLGLNPKFYYYSPGCLGKKLGLKEALNAAKSTPHYTVYSSIPVPDGISEKYRISILKELNKLISYLRLLPVLKTDKSPPDWLIEQNEVIKLASREQLIEMRQTSADILYNFFKANDRQLYDYDLKDLYRECKSILKIDPKYMD